MRVSGYAGIAGWRLLLLSVMVGAAIAAATTIGESRSAADSLSVVVASAAPLVLITLAATIVLSVGDLDLSIGGGYTFYGMALLALASLGVSAPAAYVSCFALAVAIGIVQGQMIVRRRLSPLVTTLATATILFGVSLLIEHWMRLRAEGLVAVGQGGAAAIPVISRTLPESYRPIILRYAIPWALSAIILLEYWRRRTLWGLQHVAVGWNRAAAQLAGLPSAAIRTRAFLMSSILSFGSAALVISGFQRGGWDPRAGAGLELIAIMCAVIGGTRIGGGTIEPMGAALAILLWEALAHLQYVSPLVGPETQQLVIGALLLAVAIVGARSTASN